MRAWVGQGGGGALEWGGRSWELTPSQTGPLGLRARAGESLAGPLLALEGWVASPGIATVEARRDLFVEDSRLIVSWNDETMGVSILMTWRPEGEDAVDLTISATLTAGRSPLPGFEVLVVSALPEPRGTRRRRWVEPRDALAASSSYDGRAGDVSDLTTLPPTAEGRLAPRVVPSPWDDGLSYIELVRAGDAARRITEALRINSLGHTTRYGLFGRTLEPGATMEARLRGAWVLATDPAAEALTRAEVFARDLDRSMDDAS